MSITLLCLIKGNKTANAFPVDINKDQLVGHLKKVIRKEIDVPENVKAKDLKLWNVKIPDDQDDLLSNPTLNDEDELLATKKILKYFPDSPPKEHIHVIIKLPRNLEEALSCIPPPITYSSKCTTSKNSTKVNGVLLTNVQLWGDFFKEKECLEDMGEQTFPEFYQTSKCKDVIQQIYNYMGRNELRYDSESPPVLKAYAYLTRRVKENPKSLKLQVVVPVQGTIIHQNYNFTDFKFKSILGEGRSGKTLLCEFCDNTIALKSVDLSKAPPYVLEEMQKEVEIYKDLVDIQGKYILKLICYGYYGGGMSFVISMIIVGTILSKHNIIKRQRTKALKGLEAIHKYGILHNDIREENILINDNDDIYLIDFGMASQEDTKKKRKLFDKNSSNILTC
ncbi:kinase-like protein [Rhizophagus irregularis]|uniref:Kinase-like protein n=1 Tax=Rhizophagus irregularis TaxID=588596 RepID=A0A2N0NXQ9_9GLOM|nr:kinase-like protein [Rhizophagus irregularis]